MNKHVTCVCPTYARVPHDLFCLEECVYWFTRQTYHNATLLIVNDAKDQELICNVPYVKVVNLQERFASLGEKYNYMVQIATGEIILPWEDDDISLPNRILQSVMKLGSIYEVWNPRYSWFEQNNKIHYQHPQGYNHNCSAYTREYAIKNPYSKDNKQDMGFELHARKTAKCNNDPLTNLRDWNYVYRWGHTNSGHLSGHGDTVEAWKNWRKPIPGIYEIVPRMYRDYHKDTVEICNHLKLS